jgi:hypothetical protein
MEEDKIVKDLKDQQILSAEISNSKLWKEKNWINNVAW